MKFIDSFYKTKNLAKNGVFLLISSISLILAGRILIPEFSVKKVDKQIYTLNGFITKHNDSPEMSHFIKSIKINQGYLCIGTSESTEQPGGNYYNYLNNDPEIENERFSILAGAGRTCGVFIPLFLHHRDDVDSLKIIYVINPVYWRTDLCQVQKEYWNRYANYKMIQDQNLTKAEREAYFKPVQAYLDKLNPFQKSTLWNEQVIRGSRKRYFQDLRYLFNSEEYETKYQYVPAKESNLSKYPNFGKVQLDLMDTTFNVLKTFNHKYWFKPINEDVNYRYEELKSFITLCRDLGIQATFIVEPYNQRFIENYDPKSLRGYEKTVEKIKKLLISEDADFIDASDISAVLGAFSDHQHHSNYGAYLLYKKVKSHLNAEDSI